MLCSEMIFEVILMGKVKALFKAVKARVNGAYLHVVVMYCP